MKRISKGLKEIGKTFRAAITEAGVRELSTRSSALAFTTVISVVPLIAVVLSIFKGLGGLEFAYRELEPLLLESLSEGTGEIVSSHLKEFIFNVHSDKLGWVGFAGLLLTAVTTYLTIADAFQIIWKTKKIPPLSYRIAKGTVLLVIGPLIAGLSILITTTVSTQLKNLLPFLDGSLSISAILAALSLNLVLYILVYSLIPWQRLPLRVVAKGAILPAILLEIAKSAYAFYTSKAVSYSTFYGAFAAVPLFFLWVFIAWYITLFGAVWIHCLQNIKRSSK